MVRCGARLPNGQWLDSASPYLNAAAFLNAQTPTISSALDDLADYAASSAFLHCVDGWSYLGRAVGALAAGSLFTAQHLTYYAELRAAVSLLARHGIVVADHQHYAIVTTGRAEKVSGAGTHTAAWELLNDWSMTPQAVRAFGETVRVAGHNLDAWVSARPNGPALSSAFPELLRRWGVDLRDYVADKSHRNTASYSPSRVELSAPSPSPQSIVSRIRGLWQLVEPSAPGAFRGLDEQLLVIAFDALHDAVHRPSHSSELARDQDLVAAVTNLVGMPRGEPVLTLLRPGTRPAPPEVISAVVATTPASGSRDDVLTGMLGRAVILLRFATGAVTDLVRAAGLTPAAFDPWAEEHGVTHGLWSAGDAPSPLSETWADVELALDSFEDLDLAGDIPDMAALVRNAAPALVAAAAFDRVSAWSLSA